MIKEILYIILLLAGIISVSVIAYLQYDLYKTSKYFDKAFKEYMKELNQNKDE